MYILVYGALILFFIFIVLSIIGWIIFGDGIIEEDDLESE